MQVQEQVAATQQTSLELAVNLSRIYTDSAEKLTRLGIATIRSALDEAFDLTQKALSVKDPQEWWTLQSNQFVLAAEKGQARNRQLLDIGASGQAQCAKLMQTQIETYNRQARTLMEGIVQNGPASSMPIVAALDSALSAASTLYDALQKSGQQAVEVTRSNLDLAASTASNATKRAIEPVAHAAKR